MPNYVHQIADSYGRVIMAVDEDGLIEFPTVGLAFTPAGGIARKFVNKTGAPTVRGTLVTAGSAVNSVIANVAGVPTPIGVIWCRGKADASECYVVTAGVADVLFEDGMGPTVGYWVGASASVAGRAQVLASPPGASLPAQIESHALEIGHCIQTVGSGTNVVARVALHFN